MTPRSLINLIQTEQAHMIMQYWDRQMKIVDNPADGCKFRALGKISCGTPLTLWGVFSKSVVDSPDLIFMSYTNFRPRTRLEDQIGALGSIFYKFYQYR